MLGNRLTQTVTYRNNVVFDYKRCDNHMNKAREKNSTGYDEQAWDILQNELLYNLNVGAQTSTFADRTRMSCLSNTDGIDKATHFKFVGIALNSYSRNNPRAPQGLAAAREGTFTITNTGAKKILAGENVYAFINTDNNYKPAANMYGVPKTKKLLCTTSDPAANNYTVHIGKALSTAPSNKPLDILLC